MHRDVDIAVATRAVQALTDERVRAALTTALVAQLRARNGVDRVVYQLYQDVSAADHPAERGVAQRQADRGERPHAPGQHERREAEPQQNSVQRAGQRNGVGRGSGNVCAAT